MITPMDDWLTLTNALNRTMNTHAPGWTDRNDSDPGITLLETLAFLAEGLQLRRGIVDGGERAASRVVRALQGYPAAITSSTAVQDAWSGTKRPRFFAGRLLTADDLNEEQDYHLDAHRRHLRTLHGVGVVCGLAVSDGGSDGLTVVIAPGVAVDAHGRELILARSETVAIPAGSSSPAYIELQYVERLVDPNPAAGTGTSAASRIEEGCRIAVSSAASTAVVIARLHHDAAGWHVDHTYVPNRCR
jgi:hypothetical protein